MIAPQLPRFDIKHQQTFAHAKHKLHLGMQ